MTDDAPNETPDGGPKPIFNIEIDPHCTDGAMQRFLDQAVDPSPPPQTKVRRYWKKVRIVE